MIRSSYRLEPICRRSWYIAVSDSRSVSTLRPGDRRLTDQQKKQSGRVLGTNEGEVTSSECNHSRDALHGGRQLSRTRIGDILLWPRIPRSDNCSTAVVPLETNLTFVDHCSCDMKDWSSRVHERGGWLPVPGVPCVPVLGRRVVAPS